jgi:hypothetical protein
MPDYFLSARERIHIGTCRYCNNGKGPDPDRATEGVWEGPFATRAEAFKAAKKAGYYDTRDCEFCLSQSK